MYLSSNLRQQNQISCLASTYYYLSQQLQTVSYITLLRALRTSTNVVGKRVGHASESATQKHTKKRSLGNSISQQPADRFFSKALLELQDYISIRLYNYRALATLDVEIQNLEAKKAGSFCFCLITLQSSWPQPCNYEIYMLMCVQLHSKILRKIYLVPRTLGHVLQIILMW